MVYKTIMHASNLDGNLESWIPCNKEGKKDREWYVWMTNEEK